MAEREPARGDRPVFEIGRRTVTVQDVIQSAHFRGELEPCWTRTLGLLACEKRAAERLLEPNAVALQAISEQFRIERDLITAEETERWLEERGLTLDDFSDFFLRRYWENELGEKIEPEAIDCLSASAELRDLLKVELLLSGELDRLAVRLSWRFAAGQIAAGEATPELVEAERQHFFKRSGLDAVTLREWLARLGGDPHWLTEMLELEAAFRRQRATLLTAEALGRTLHSLRMPLTRLELEVIDLESADAAREAFLCVQEDGMPMSEVAKTGRYPCRSVEVLIEDLPAEWQQRFLSAAPGEVAEPIARSEGFQLSRLVRKIEPDLADDQVRRRVEERIVERHFSELAAECVRWTMPLNTIGV